VIGFMPRLIERISCCVILPLVLLNCSDSSQHDESRELAVQAYGELISQDVLDLDEVDHLRFCLAEDTGDQDYTDPPDTIVSEVKAKTARDVRPISECDTEWLVDRVPRKDLDRLDVMLWLRQMAISEEKATATIVASGRYGHRMQFFCEFARGETGWSIVSVNQGVIE